MNVPALRTIVLCSLLLLLRAAPVRAHHSFAMYDQTKLVDIEGEVHEFQWTNPHVILWVTRDAVPGQERELWTIELPTSTGNLARMDWSKRSLVPGDRVKVEINPLRDGQHGGSFKKVTIAATGKVLIASAPPPSAAASDAAVAPPPAAAPAAAPASSCACSTLGARKGRVEMPWTAYLTVSALLLRGVRRWRRRTVA